MIKRHRHRHAQLRADLAAVAAFARWRLVLRRRRAAL